MFVIFLSSVYWPTLPVLFPFISIKFPITTLLLFLCSDADWVHNPYKFWVKTRFIWFSYSTWKGFRTKLGNHISCHTSQTYTQALREKSGSLFQYTVHSNATVFFSMPLCCFLYGIVALSTQLNSHYQLVSNSNRSISSFMEEFTTERASQSMQWSTWNSTWLEL